MEQDEKIIDDLSNNTVLSFIINEEGQIYTYLNIKELTEKNKENLVKFLTELNIGMYVYDMIGLVDQLAINKPEAEEYFYSLKQMWLENLKKMTSETTTKEALEEDLIVKPTEFIKYPGFSGK